MTWTFAPKILLPWRSLAALALVFCGLTCPASADITIATASPLKGPYAALGEGIRRGVAQAVIDINASGGINGEKLVLRSEDDACDPRQAVTVAQALIEAKVNLVVGHYCSSASLVAAPLYAQAGIMMITPAATMPQVTEQSWWNVFRLVGRDDAQGTFAGAYVAKTYPGKQVAILHDGSSAGTLVAQAFKQALNHGGTVEALYTTFKPGQNDYPDLVNQILAAKIEVLYVPGPAAEAGTLIRALKDLASPAQLIGNDSLLVAQFWEVAGTNGEGTLATLALDALKLDTAKVVVATFQRSGGLPLGHTLNAYAAVQAYAAAAKATNSLDNRVLSPWLRAGNPVDTVLGQIAFDAKGDLTNPIFSWYRWSAGKFSLYEPPTGN